MSAALAVTVLADNDTDKGSPIGLFVVLLLVVAVYFLYRSMNRHMRNLPESFDPPVGEAKASNQAPVGQPAASNEARSSDRDVAHRTGPEHPELPR